MLVKLLNLFSLYWNIVDNIFIYDSNLSPLQIVFEKNKYKDKIYNEETWSNIKNESKNL